MRAQIARARLLWEHTASSELKDRYAFLKTNHGLNTPSMAAELMAIKTILKGRSRRARRL